jgi:hypothetical protein
MISKAKLIIVFSVMVFIGLFSYGIHLFETKDSFKIEYIASLGVDSIKIIDRGLTGMGEITIENQDTINKIKMLLFLSKPVPFDVINFHSNKGSLDLLFNSKGKKIAVVSISKTPLMNSSVLHGILSSGDYHYQNDSLLNLLTARLQNKTTLKNL